MNLPYPNDPASQSQPNPLFNDNAFVRGDQFRTNNNRIWNNFTSIAAFLTSNFLGIIFGRLYVLAASSTVIRIPVNNVYDVSGEIVAVSLEKTLDFSGLTNIFRTDGTTQITNVSETQNKHLYLLLTSTGTLQAMIIPNTDIANHNYLTNPLLLEAYYTGTPAIWDSAKNGYYRNSKRIIATMRLDGSNNIQFFYELGTGYRFQDVLNFAVGNLYSELRWQRCNPNCYLLDGSTIASMSTESPLLYFLLGTNVLPNFTDRFLRNIDIAGARALRDLQTDQMQGFDIYLEGYAAVGSQDRVATGSNAGGAVNTNVSHTKIISNGVDGTPRFGSETRPLNFAASLQIVRG